jgi:hypothetical protein
VSEALPAEAPVPAASDAPPVSAPPDAVSGSDVPVDSVPVAGGDSPAAAPAVSVVLADRPVITPPAVAVAPELPARAGAPRTLRLAETRARAQVATGVLLAAGGLAGLAVMANGLYVHGISERELARGGGYPAELLAPLERQHERSETRIAAGAVAGAVGLAFGVALIVPGVRGLRAGRPEQARLRLTPLVGGVLVSGRF